MYSAREHDPALCESVSKGTPGLLFAPSASLCPSKALSKQELCWDSEGRDACLDTPEPNREGATEPWPLWTLPALLLREGGKKVWSQGMMVRQGSSWVVVE